jgi:hypothetical protein
VPQWCPAGLAALAKQRELLKEVGCKANQRRSAFILNLTWTDYGIHVCNRGKVGKSKSKAKAKEKEKAPKRGQV